MGNRCQSNNSVVNNPLQQSQPFPPYIEDIVNELRRENVREGEAFKLQKYGKGHIFRGNFIQGKKQGYGEYLFKQNAYFGLFQNDLPNGTGILVFNSIDFIKGTFKYGKPNGQCREKVSNIDFVGDFQQGQRKEGILKTNEYTYDGEFSKNRFERLGKIQFKTGEVYEGEFENGEYHGMGKYIGKDGSYNGNFQKGIFEGKGIYRWKDGSFYEGYYKNGERNGYGRFVQQQFSYEGQWLNGKPSKYIENKTAYQKQQRIKAP